MGWSIALYLGEPRGTKIIGRKNRRPYDDAMYIPDSHCWKLEKIIGHPYSLVQKTWIGSELDELLAQINQLITEWENTIIQRFLEKIKHSTEEEWMKPMIKKELNKFQPLLKLREFLYLVIRAKSENGTILVCGD